MSDTDFAAADPAGQLGQRSRPEGNAHQAEFTRDNEFFFATDEDFDPYRVQGTFGGGAGRRAAFTAIQAGDAKAITRDAPLSRRHAVPRPRPASRSRPPARQIAVIERGVCDFQVKLDNIMAAGYKWLVVFNRTGEDGCDTLVNMLASSETTPAIFVSRRDGFRLLGRVARPATRARPRRTVAARATPAAGPGAAGEHLRRLRRLGLHAHVQATPNGAKMQRGRLSTRRRRSQDPAFAEDYGDMRVHEVATDPGREPRLRLALRARHARAELRDSGLEEVGKFVEQGGSNYWGVEVHKFGGQKYILGSDRDRGLRIFQFSG